MPNSNGFTENADLYRTSQALLRVEDLETGLEALGEVDGLEVLDIATGTGHTAFFFAERQAHVFAVDINEEMLRIAEEESQRKTLSVRFIKCPASELYFDDETFDLVVCRMGAHHFPDPNLFLEETSRVLRPYGRLLLIDNVVPEDSAVAGWVNAYETDRDPTHQACLSLQDWQTRLQRQFKVTHHQVEAWELDFDAWMQRMSIHNERREEFWLRLESAPPEVKDFLKPEQDGETRSVTLHRAIMVAERTGSS